MKVIFLDVDGVLNCHRTAIAFGHIPNTTARNGRASLDEVAIRLIGGIARAAKVSIVLSSTWRKHADWRDYGPALGLPSIAKTPVLCGPRGAEIAAWLTRYPEVERYAIVDDDSDMLDSQLPFFVKTIGFDGFTWANAEKLAQLMGVSIYDVDGRRLGVPEVTKGLNWAES